MTDYSSSENNKRRSDDLEQNGNRNLNNGNRQNTSGSDRKPQKDRESEKIDRPSLSSSDNYERDSE